MGVLADSPLTAPTMLSTPDLDAIRQGVLDRMERDGRRVKLAIIGAALLESLLLIVAFRLVDWHDRTQSLVFVIAALLYSIFVLGLLALGAHVSRSVGRVLVALQARDS